MSLAVLTQDLAVLPAALLPLAKFHCRIDPTGDVAADTQQDEFMKSLIARAIGHLQDKLDVAINPSTWAWTPAEDEFTVNGSGKATIPVRPVSSFAAAIPPDNVTADYVIMLKWDSPFGIPIQQLVGPQAAGLSVTLTAGMPDLADPAKTTPVVLDLVLRMVSVLHEHREIFGEGREPMTLPPIDQASAWWMPRL